MLPKSRRLARHDFPSLRRSPAGRGEGEAKQPVYQTATGFIVHAPHTSLRVAPSKTSKKSRFSAVISKKIAASSPARHLWKRRVYEAVADFEKKNPLPAAAYIFFAKKDAHKLSYKILVREVKNLLEQVI